MGQIVVHDRNRVETEVLPRYFNHASFASLRRQLNYFNFARVGKGRQRGATYCNENVVNLDDILRLKRRAAGKTSTGSPQNTPSSKNVSNEKDKKILDEETTPQQEIEKKQIEYTSTFTPITEKKSEKIIQMESPSHGDYSFKSRGRKRYNSIVPVVHLPPKKKVKNEMKHSIHYPISKSKQNKYSRDKSFEPEIPYSYFSLDKMKYDSLTADEKRGNGFQIYLDLTKPINQDTYQNGPTTLNQNSQSIPEHLSSTTHSPSISTEEKKEELNQDFPMLYHSYHQHGYHLHDMKNSKTETNVMPSDYSPCTSSDETTDEEDIVACNVLLALSCRS